MQTKAAEAEGQVRIKLRQMLELQGMTAASQQNRQGPPRTQLQDSLTWYDHLALSLCSSPQHLIAGRCARGCAAEGSGGRQSAAERKARISLAHGDVQVNALVQAAARAHMYGMDLALSPDAIWACLVQAMAIHRTQSGPDAAGSGAESVRTRPEPPGAMPIAEWVQSARKQMAQSLQEHRRMAWHLSAAFAPLVSEVKRGRFGHRLATGEDAFGWGRRDQGVCDGDAWQYQNRMPMFKQKPSAAVLGCIARFEQLLLSGETPPGDDDSPAKLTNRRAEPLPCRTSGRRPGRGSAAASSAAASASGAGCGGGLRGPTAMTSCFSAAAVQQRPFALASSPLLSQQAAAPSQACVRSGSSFPGSCSRMASRQLPSPQAERAGSLPLLSPMAEAACTNASEQGASHVGIQGQASSASPGRAVAAAAAAAGEALCNSPFADGISRRDSSAARQPPCGEEQRPAGPRRQSPQPVAARQNTGRGASGCASPFLASQEPLVAVSPFVADPPACSPPPPPQALMQRRLVEQAAEAEAQPEAVCGSGCGSAEADECLALARLRSSSGLMPMSSGQLSDLLLPGPAADCPGVAGGPAEGNETADRGQPCGGEAGSQRGRDAAAHLQTRFSTSCAADLLMQRVLLREGEGLRMRRSAARPALFRPGPHSGIAHVELRGQAEDWALLRERAQRLMAVARAQSKAEEKQVIDDWAAVLLPVLDALLRAAEVGEASAADEAWWEQLLCSAEDLQAQARRVAAALAACAGDSSPKRRRTDKAATGRPAPGKGQKPVEELTVSGWLNAFFPYVSLPSLDSRRGGEAEAGSCGHPHPAAASPEPCATWMPNPYLKGLPAKNRVAAFPWGMELPIVLHDKLHSQHHAWLRCGTRMVLEKGTVLEAANAWALVKDR